MNILIPHHWLLNHLKTQVTPKKIQKCLSLCGPSVEQIKKVGQEPVYDIEITTNRIDTVSIRGIAREAAVILPQFGLKARLKPLKLKPPPLKKITPRGNTSPKTFPIKIVNNPKLCHRILAVALEVKVGESPLWLKDRLSQINQRPLNNLIDITNYVMTDLGHPIHAFDLDRLGKTMIIRQSKKGEKITTLDGQTHTLPGGDIVVDNGQGELTDLIGIMGTQNSVITSKTKKVLLFIESNDPIRIRTTSMSLAIRTLAAAINEKSPDPELAKTTLLKAIELYQQIAQAKVLSPILDFYPHKPQPKTVTLSQSLIDTYLGIKLDSKIISRFLTGLGCQIKVQKPKVKTQNKYIIKPPSWRIHDLTIPEDYIEEIARIYGYHQLPSTLMATPIPDNPPEENFHLEQTIKQWLAGWGLTEVYTYSMVSQKLARQSGHSLKSHLKLKNPLTKDWVYLRRSLIPSHLEVIQKNKKQTTINIFELANVYLAPPKRKHSKPSLPEEQLQLVVTTTGPYSHLKGIADSLLKKLHLPKTKFIPQENHSLAFAPGQTAIIHSGKTLLGCIGRAKNSSSFALKLLVKPLTKLSSTHPTYTPLAATPPIIEDLTFTLSQRTYIGPVIDSIKTTSSLIESVVLKDTYRQNYTFTITYRHPEKSLTDAQIKPIRQKIVNLIEKTFKAKLKGEV